MEQREAQEYYKKANKLMEETDGALLVYIQKDENGKAVNCVANAPENAMEAVLMFRAVYMASVELLKALADEDVRKYGAEEILRAATFADEPENLQKSFIFDPRKRKG